MGVSCCILKDIVGYQLKWCNNFKSKNDDGHKGTTKIVVDADSFTSSRPIPPLLRKGKVLTNLSQENNFAEELRRYITMLSNLLRMKELK